MNAHRKLALALITGLGACQTGSTAPAIGANIINVQGQSIGRAMVTQTAKGVKIKVQVSGLATGRHGIHIHAVGRCNPPDFMSAGPHFNPDSLQHGARSAAGKHAGDLPNLEVDRSGKADQTFEVEGLTLDPGPRSLLSPQNRSLVIHADPDDEITDPSGKSGPRIACAAF
jgi:Cu-Zn family superoxide dismutase